jgi:hypothetical protein
MATPALRFALVVPLAFAGGACTTDDGQDEHADDESEGGEQSDCEAETRDDEFMIGLSKSGQSVTATFVSAEPAPPIKGDNTWTVMLSDPTASITAAIPFMPDHEHGTAVEAVVSATANPGEYVIEPVNLFMSGLWEITLDISTQAGTTDEVVFAFCVE